MEQIPLNVGKAQTDASTATQHQSVVYCFELFVLNVTDIIGSIRHPAVAFRLLDFPMVVVHAPKTTLSKDTRTLPFHCGKSCLFELTASSFDDLLGRIPLQVMLMEIQIGSTGQLIGQCSVDLSSIRREVILPVNEAPRGHRKGTFTLHDLMGNEVGKITIVLRLSCMGSALLPHLRVVPLLNRTQKETVTDLPPDGSGSTRSLHVAAKPVVHLEEASSPSHSRLRSPLPSNVLQHPHTAQHELDSFAVQASAEQFATARTDPTTPHYASQLSLGSGSITADPTSKKSMPVAQLNDALAKELEHHNLRLAQHGVNDQYASKRLVDDVFSHPSIIPQADDYAPPALFYYKGTEADEQTQKSLLEVEYDRCVTEKARQRETEEQRRKDRDREKEREQSHLHKQLDAQPSVLDFYHARHQPSTDSLRPHHTLDHENEKEWRRRPHHQSDAEQNQTEQANHDPHAKQPLSPKSPRTSHQHTKSPHSSPRLTKSKSAASKIPRPTALTTSPSSSHLTLPVRHATRHQSPARVAGRKGLSVLEQKFRAMEQAMEEEAKERSKHDPAATAIQPSPIPFVPPPRLSIEDRGRVRRASAESKVHPGSGMIFDAPAEHPPTVLAQPAFAPLEEIPPPSKRGLPKEYGPLKKKRVVGVVPKSTHRRPPAAAKRASASSSSSSGPFSRAFETIQLEHETLQPSPISASRTRSAIAPLSPSGDRKKMVQFESPTRECVEEPRIPSPPSVSSGSDSPGAQHHHPSPHFDNLLHDVESQLQAKRHVFREATRASGPVEFISPLVRAKSESSWPPEYQPLMEIGNNYPVTESQLAQVALNFLNHDSANSRGAMSQSLLHRQLTGITSMLQQPEKLIHDKIRQMTAHAATDNAATGGSLPSGPTYQWEENLTF